MTILRYCCCSSWYRTTTTQQQQQYKLLLSLRSNYYYYYYYHCNTTTKHSRTLHNQQYNKVYNRSDIFNNNNNNNNFNTTLRRTTVTTSAVQKQKQQQSASSSSISSFFSSSTRWKRIAYTIRYVRIPLLVLSVYSIGYQQGVIDCTKEPISLQNQLMRGILFSTGCKNDNDIHIINENDIKKWRNNKNDNNNNNKQYQQVAIVGQKIVNTARNFVELNLNNAMNALKEKLPEDSTDVHVLQEMEKDDTIQFWYNARLRLEGENINILNWEFIFINTNTPNAFVTEILPRKFFITTGMLNIATSSSELAIVLGHEISHLILGHVSDTNKIETILRTIEVLLLSIDPTAGIISVFIIGILYTLRKMISASYSRENEIKADDLGIALAAAACYDTIAGCEVLYKMHHMNTSLVSSKNDIINSSKPGTTNDNDNDNKINLPTIPSNNNNTAIIRLMDTHPPTLERYERMKRNAIENGENYTKYNDCIKITTRLYNALFATTTTIGK